MIFYVYVKRWFVSVVHGNSIMNLKLWKGKDIFKRCGIEMNIKWEQIQWCSLYVILTATVVVDSWVVICIPYVINKISVTNASDSITGIKEYPNEGNEKFWLI